MSYLGNNSASGVSSRTPFEITATQGQTLFTVSGYNPDTVEVLRNGARLAKADYAATDGVTVTLGRGCAAGDVVTIVPNTDITVSGSYSKAEANALFAESGASNAWTATQAPVSGNLTDGAAISWDAGAIQLASVTLGGNRTLSNPTNVQGGATYVLQVSQGAAGGNTLAWGSMYKFPGGTAPTLSTSASALDIFTFVAAPSGAYMRCVGIAKDVK